MVKLSILVCFVSVFNNFYVKCYDDGKFEKFIEYFDQYDSLETFGGHEGNLNDDFIGDQRNHEEEQSDCYSDDLRCVPPIQCAARLNPKHNRKISKCRLPNKNWGLCCDKGYQYKEPPRVGQQHQKLQKPFNVFEILKEAKEIAANMTKFRSHETAHDNPDFFHSLMFKTPHLNLQKDNEASKSALEQIVAGKLISLKEQVPPDEVFDSADLRSENNVCLEIPVCKSTNLKYRTATGHCNNPNPNRSFWGAADQPMERLMYPAYEDQIWSPRMHSVDGSLLVSPRKISRILFPDIDRPHHLYNLLFMQFGQFITHDFTQGSTIRSEDGGRIQCCSDDGSSVLPPDQRHFACLPIEIEPDDGFYSEFKQGCMNFIRLSLAPYFNCRIGYGKQISKVTHYLDASPVYGSSIEDQRLLRSFRGGQLQMFFRRNGDMLPITTRNETCANVAEGKVCYLAGDGRTNQIISLTLLHTLFAREHNRLANSLAEINPHYSDEILFQEARRILIGELQHIIYSEYLPLVIGSSAMRRFGLSPERDEYSVDYDPDVNPASMNEFTGAAFRFGHSTVDGHFHIAGPGRKVESIEIPDVMFDASRLESPGFPEALMDNMLTQSMQKVDNSITVGLSGFMFRGSKPFGLDLAALNIQRGRDQGIRSYNDYLELIGRKRKRSFEEFGPAAARLRQVYSDPDDVDLWVGGLLESPYEDAVVGQLFVEIIAEQFSRFKKGDRYFYSHHPKINPGHFNSCQLSEIRKVTFARIICDNMESITHVQPFALFNSDYPGNRAVRCESLPRVDLTCWGD